MVQYKELRFWDDTSARDRSIDRLLDLRRGLAVDVTPNHRDSSFHLATWNIRDLGSEKLNPGPRLDETFLYIAEVISKFDLVAVQEVNRNIADFSRVVRLLGPGWDYIVTDESGNDERLAFVFNKSKIWFRNIVGEIVLPKKKGKEPIQFNLHFHDHIFHIHVNDFELTKINGEPLAETVWLDTAVLPRNGSITFRSRFLDFTGKYVLHCHMMNHEELGMMQVVEVYED